MGRRTTEAWKRFGAWYGADALERKFGLTPPQDWCDVIDELSRDELDAVMADVKQQFPTWMPGLPDFEAIVRRIKKPVRGPSIAEQLHDFALKNYPLTTTQLRLPWNFIGTPEGVVRGVYIPSDGEKPGYRIMVEDMQLGRVA